MNGTIRCTGTAALGLAAVVALTACGSGLVADYRLADQLEELPRLAEDGQALTFSAAHLERMEELLGEEIPQGPHQDHLDEIRDWSARGFDGSASELQAQPPVTFFDQDRGLYWEEEWGLSWRDLDAFTEARGTAPVTYLMRAEGDLDQEDLGPGVSGPEEDGVYTAETGGFPATLRWQEDGLLLAASEEADGLLRSEEAPTFGEDEALITVAEEIDSKAWYWAGVVEALPALSQAPEEHEPLEPYLWLGFGLDVVDEQHITRVVFVHEDEESAETNAGRIQDMISASGESAYEYMELEEIDADGEVLTLTVANDPSGPSLWSLAVTYQDPLFGYRVD